MIVRDVPGEPKTKRTGLVVVDGTLGAAIEDVVIDGVVAHHTTQWAGVMVIGTSREKRARHVTVRNTLVHDVFGDGIVLYRVEDAGRAAGAAPVDASVALPAPQAGRWTLSLRAAVSPMDARSQLVFLETAMAQYGDSRLTAVVSGADGWPLEKVRAVAAEDARTGVLLSLSSPAGNVVCEWRTFAAPADLGLTLRHVLGPPR